MTQVDPRPCVWCDSPEAKCRAWNEERRAEGKNGKCCPDCDHQDTGYRMSDDESPKGHVCNCNPIDPHPSIHENWCGDPTHPDAVVHESAADDGGSVG